MLGTRTVELKSLTRAGEFSTEIGEKFLEASGGVFKIGAAEL